MAIHLPRILARRSDGALLVQLDETGGCVYEPARRIVHPRIGLATLAAQPYWEDYHGTGEELRNWPGPSTLPPQSPIVLKPNNSTGREE